MQNIFREKVTVQGVNVVIISVGDEQTEMQEAGGAVLTSLVHQCRITHKMAAAGGIQT